MDMVAVEPYDIGLASQGVRFRGIQSSPGPLTLDDRLVFMHIPKTAGCTVNACLQPLFEPAQICPERDAGIALWPKARTSAFRYFSCHARLPEFRFIEGPLKLITFLRDPIERSVSCFEYWASYTDRAIAEQRLAVPRLAKTLGLKGFYDEQNAAQCGRFWNTYTTWLVADPHLSPAGRPWSSKAEIIDAALTNLESMAFIGFTEDMAGSFDRLSRQFDLPNCYAHQALNVTRTNHVQNPAIFDPVPQYAFDEETIGNLERTNELDAIVYDHARAMLPTGQPLQQAIDCVASGAGNARVRAGRTGTWVENAGGGFVLHGPYRRLLPGRYRVHYSLRPSQTAQRSGTTETEFGYVDTAANEGQTVFARANHRQRRPARDDHQPGPGSPPHRP